MHFHITIKDDYFEWKTLIIEYKEEWYDTLLKLSHYYFSDQS